MTPVALQRDVTLICSGSDEPRRLLKEIGCGWSLTGWLDAGATANADNPRTRYNGPVTFNDRGRVQGNQVYMSFGREADNGSCGIAFGGQADVMFGTDYLFSQSAGLELHDNFARHWNRSGEQYGLALPQFYGEVALRTSTSRWVTSTRSSATKS